MARLIDGILRRARSIAARLDDQRITGIRLNLDNEQSDVVVELAEEVKRLEARVRKLEGAKKRPTKRKQ